MSKPTKRVIGSTIISFQMTEYRAERFTDLLNMFIEAMKAEPYPREFLAEHKEDFIKISTNVEEV